MPENNEPVEENDTEGHAYVKVPVADAANDVLLRNDDLLSRATDQEDDVEGHSFQGIDPRRHDKVQDEGYKI